MALLADLITGLRTAIDDLAGDKIVFRENLARSIRGNQITSAGSYKLNNERIVATTLQVNVDSTGFKVIGGGGGQVPGTETDATGQFTLTTPAATSLLAIYQFQYLTDAELTTFLNRAASFVSQTDPTVVEAGLVDALTFKAGSDACFSISARRAGLYNAGAGGKTAQKGDISKKYKDMATDLFNRAVAERLAFYGDRKGAASSPAYGQFATKQNPYTPER